MKTKNHFKKFLKIIRVENSSYNAKQGIFIDCLASTKPESSKSYLINLSPLVSEFFIRELERQLKKCKRTESQKKFKNKFIGGLNNEKQNSKENM